MCLSFFVPLELNSYLKGKDQRIEITKLHKFFNKNSELTYVQNVRKKSLKKLLKKDYQLLEKYATQWSDFLLYMLHVDYKQRPSARKILEKYSQWLVEP